MTLASVFELKFTANSKPILGQFLADRQAFRMAGVLQVHVAFATRAAQHLDILKLRHL